jgi:polyglutamine-binding protein 1
MDNYQNQPLPPGVETWPRSLPNHPPQFDAGSHPYPPPFDTTPGIGNVSGNGNTTDIESAVQEAVLHAQDIETQQIIQSQRQAKMTSESAEYGVDILSSRQDPNALKEHLLKMTADHRTEMANKKGKPIHLNNDNVEIGNGYGVPGGGAYYAQMNKPMDETDKAKCANDLPEFLKKRLKARGILKDKTENKNSVSTQNVDYQEDQNKSAQVLPPGWAEAKDPTTGASYFYNHSTGVTQWDRPGGAVNTMQHQVSPSLPQNWEEAIDESTGNKYYYNTKTQATQWEPPTSVDANVAPHAPITVPPTSVNVGLAPHVPTYTVPPTSVSASVAPYAPTNTAVVPVAPTTDIWNSQMQRCLGCGGWGLGLVQQSGYCNHCMRGALVQR